MKLPDGWSMVRLEELCDPSFPLCYGVVQPGEDSEQGVPLVRVCDLADGTVLVPQLRRISQSVAAEYRRSALVGGELLVSLVGTVGRTAIVPHALAGANIARALARLTITGDVTARWTQYVLNTSSMQHSLIGDAREVARKTLNLAQLRDTEVPLPPLNEQRRIVDKIEALTARSRRAKEALDAVPALLDRLRQSILAAAFRGDLTKEWRAAHPDVEPASVLLDRIRKERRARWEEAELAKMRAKGSPPKDDKWKSKYVEPEPVNTDDLPELPEGWAWARAEEICDLITKGTTPPTHRMSSGQGDVPYIKVYNLTFSGKLDFTVEPTFVDEATHRGDLARSRVFPGDVLMNIVGPPLGKVSVVPDAYAEWNINQAIAIFRPLKGVLSSYVSLYLQCHETISSMVQQAKATAGQLNLTLEICRNIFAPIPPFEEQAELSRVASAYAATSLSNGATVETLIAQLQRLDSSILAKAFRGELVPQDPNDEPASALLERIRAERESAVTTTPTKKTRTKRAAKSSKSASR